MGRYKGPEKAQIRLRVRKELADAATAMGAAWLERWLDFAVRADGPLKRPSAEGFALSAAQTAEAQKIADELANRGNP